MKPLKSLRLFSALADCSIIAVMLFTASNASACLNLTGTKYNTESTTYHGKAESYALRHSLESNRHPDGEVMEAGLRGSTNFNDRSDYSVALLYLGRYQEAIDLLNGLEKEKPGFYFVAANLGTAYELAGHNQSALKWINEGIQRNPDSHDGTEWLHAKIIEAKINQQKDPGYFQHHSVLELHPAKIGEDMEIGGERKSSKEVTGAIQYQLTERLQFVKPPDPAVASLLFDYAAIEAATKTVESAKLILQLAIEYGYPPDQVSLLMKDFDQRIARRKIRGYLGYFVLGLAACAVLAVLYRAGIFVLSAKDLKRS